LLIFLVQKDYRSIGISMIYARNYENKSALVKIMHMNAGISFGRWCRLTVTLMSPYLKNRSIWIMGISNDTQLNTGKRKNHSLSV